MAMMPHWGLPALSWLVSFYFLLGFTQNVGFPPDRAMLVGDTLYVALWLLFLFLPFFSKIKLGSVLELEREVAKAKQDLQDFKNEVRSTIGVMSTNVNTIGRMNNQVTFNMPGAQQLRDNREEMRRKAPATEAKATEIRGELQDAEDDNIVELARTRIEIERQLRHLVGKRVGLATGESEIKYASLNQLFAMFIGQHPQFQYLTVPFRNVVRICNAAMHAQLVSAEQAKETIAAGAQIIAILKDQVGPAVVEE